jgi:hypothetical protein
LNCVIVVAAVALTLVVGAAAASTVVVTPTNTHGWTTGDTRPGGAVNFVVDPTAPSGAGALQLTTDVTTAAKAQYVHATSTPLSSVTELSYYTKQNSALVPVGDPSYQLATCLGGIVGGNCVGYTNFVFEPYWNGVVVPGTWQYWDVDAGQFWSSGTYAAGTCAVVSGAGGPPFYNLTAIKAMCPDAVVVGFGVNIGTYNPGYDVETDLVDFNGTTYDFEPFTPGPTSKDQCKDGGWQQFDHPAFKNQGDCVSSFANDA